MREARDREAKKRRKGEKECLSKKGEVEWSEGEGG